MIRIAIVDDDQTSSNILRDHIKRYYKDNNKDIDIVAFKDGDEVIDNYKGVYDVIFWI